jgi:carboxymethylenebutenolidase
VEPHIRELAQRLASEGFVVMVPDLYHGKIATEPGDAQKLVMLTFENIEKAIDEIVLALEYLRKNAGVQPKKLGLMGFCMGGHLTYRVAERYAHLGAASPWYAGGYDPSAEQIAAINAPVLAFYGETDGGIPVAQVRKVEGLFKDAGKDAEFHIYPNAGHAFNNPDHGMYAPEAARDAWARAMAFFKDKLK